MSDRSTRLLNARVSQGFATASAGALAAGVSKATYIHHENGTREFSIEQALVYSKVFNASVAWLLYGDEPDDEPRPSMPNSLVGMFFIRDGGEFYATGQILSEVKDGVYLIATDAPVETITIRPMEVMSIEDMLGLSELGLPLMSLFRTRADLEAWLKWLNAPEKPSVINLVKPDK